LDHVGRAPLVFRRFERLSTGRIPLAKVDVAG
jgi:hypothetical protein